MNYDITFFDKYNRGELPAKDRISFEKQLNEKPQLRQEFQAFLELTEQITALEGDVFQQEIKASLRQAIQAEQQSKIILLYRYWKYAAVAAVILLIGLPFTNWLTYNQKISARHSLGVYENTLMGETTRANWAENKKYLKNGKALATQQVYEEAIQQLEQVKILNSDEYGDYFLAQYELALIYVSQNENAKAIEILTDLTQRKELHRIKKNAEALLKDLNRSPFFFF